VRKARKNRWELLAAINRWKLATGTYPRLTDLAGAIGVPTAIVWTWIAKALELQRIERLPGPRYRVTWRHALDYVGDELK
jgi:hypothetical protein